MSSGLQESGGCSGGVRDEAGQVADGAREGGRGEKTTCRRAKAADGERGEELQGEGGEGRPDPVPVFNIGWETGGRTDVCLLSPAAGAEGEVSSVEHRGRARCSPGDKVQL